MYDLCTGTAHLDTLQVVNTDVTERCRRLKVVCVWALEPLNSVWGVRSRIIWWSRSSILGNTNKTLPPSVAGPGLGFEERSCQSHETIEKAPVTYVWHIKQKWSK
jgi:hypothetical protein